MFSASSNVVFEDKNKKKNSDMNSTNEDKSQIELANINNMIIMNNKFRSGGMFNEWEKSLTASVKIGERNVVISKNHKKKDWEYERDMYSKTSNIFLNLSLILCFYNKKIQKSTRFQNI